MSYSITTLYFYSLSNILFLIKDSCKIIKGKEIITSKTNQPFKYCLITR